MSRRVTSDLCPEPGWRGLSYGIVRQAADDYLCERKRGASRRVLTREMKELLDFFHGEWYRQLCPLDPDWLLAELDKAMIENRRN